MVTYVINTSENKTFDSDQLFRLVGYNKIQWLNCSLDRVEDCVDFIKNKQGAIEAEEFRLAVLIDFYGFNRIRAPYGRHGYGKDEGVECSLYLPYIEAYLKDNLLYVLEKQEYYAAECDVFYIKSGDFEVIDNIDNLEEQVNQIVSPVESSFVGKKKTYVSEEVDVYIDSDGKVYAEEVYLKAKKEIEELNDLLAETETKKGKAELVEKIQEKMDFVDNVRPSKKTVRKMVEEDAYTAFSLYCTRQLSLEYKVKDFPYGVEENEGEGASQSTFFRAFCERAGKTRKIRRHFYHTSVGGSVARAAFDNLALSLHLIRLYEREDRVVEEGDIEISGVDPEQLKNLLITAWNKIVCARTLAKENKSLYYSLKQISEKEIKIDVKKQSTPEEDFKKERTAVVVKDSKIRNSIEDQYKLIMKMGKQGEGEFIDEDKEEFDRILGEYLVKRDQMNEKDVDDRFDELIRSDSLATTNMCPSKQEYDFVINEKYDEISKLMGETLKAEYVVNNFEEEQKKADKYYENYLKAKKILNRNIAGDIIFLLLTVAIMIVPFIILKSVSEYNFGTIMVYVFASAIFAGLFLFSLFFTLLPTIRKLKKAKNDMLECYKDCLAKKKVALKQLKKRYEVDLINIEEFRYEIRQITLLYQANLLKDKNVNKHRVILEDVENCLSGILNNLGIHPTIDDSTSVDGEFNLLRSIRSPENKVYKIFSLDAIESVLVGKGRGGE